VAGAVDDQAAAAGVTHDQPVERDVLALLDGDQGRLGGDGQVGPVYNSFFALVGRDEDGGVDGARLLDVQPLRVASGAHVDGVARLELIDRRLNGAQRLIQLVAGVVVVSFRRRHVVRGGHATFSPCHSLR